MCHNIFAVDVVSHLHFTTNKEPRRLFSAASVPCFLELFCYSSFLYGESPAEGFGLLYCERMKKFRNIRKCGSDCRRVSPVRSNEQQAAADRKRVKGVNLTEQVLNILFF